MNDQDPSENYDSVDHDSFSSEHSRNFVEEQFDRVLSLGPDPNINFYREYCRLYLSNVQLLAQVSSSSTQVRTAPSGNRQPELRAKSRLKPHTTTMAAQHHSNPEDRESTEEKKKRMRRTAGEIARHYVCSYEKCQKSYGSEGSLNQHIKLKHGNIAHR